MSHDGRHVVHQKASLEATGGGEVMHMLGHIMLFGFQHLCFSFWPLLLVRKVSVHDSKQPKQGLSAWLLMHYRTTEHYRF